MSDYKSLADFNAALERVKGDMPSLMVQPVKTALNDLAITIRQRVAGTGETMTGGSFSVYSAKHAKKKQRQGRPPYGKKTDRKNFYFQGTMWNSFGVTKISEGNSNINATMNYKGSNVYKSNEELNEIHSDNEGVGIAYPNQQEELILVGKLEQDLVRILERIL